jgi:hypothetical protein
VGGALLILPRRNLDARAVLTGNLKVQYSRNSDRDVCWNRVHRAAKAQRTAGTPVLKAVRSIGSDLKQEMSMPSLRRFGLDALVVLASLLAPCAFAFAERGEFGADGSDVCMHSHLEQPVRRQPAVVKEFDEATGRDMRNFPPDRVVDFKHLKLQMRFEDIDIFQIEIAFSISICNIALDYSS